MRENSSRVSSVSNARSRARTSARSPVTRSRCSPSAGSIRVAATTRSWLGGARRIRSSALIAAGARDLEVVDDEDERPRRARRPPRRTARRTPATPRRSARRARAAASRGRAHGRTASSTCRQNGARSASRSDTHATAPRRRPLPQPRREQDGLARPRAAPRRASAAGRRRRRRAGRRAAAAGSRRAAPSAAGAPRAGRPPSPAVRSEPGAG